MPLYELHHLQQMRALLATTTLHATRARCVSRLRRCCESSDFHNAKPLKRKYNRAWHATCYRDRSLLDPPAASSCAARFPLGHYIRNAALMNDSNAATRPMHSPPLARLSPIAMGIAIALLSPCMAYAADERSVEEL